MTDIKIRLGAKEDEEWVEHWIKHILAYDWDNQPLGVHKFQSRAAMINGKAVSYCALYRTKTLRVAYISSP